MGQAGPVVSVVTPFYNTAEFLAECIESVLSQTLGDFEYVLADNASTDGSGDIAGEYARKDPRIRLLRFDEHVGQIPNYNRALRHADGSARYCKIAQADDLLLPDCLEQMVALADTDPEIVLVGAYAIVQDHVYLNGLDYYRRVLPGDELCRWYLRDGPYLFGSPTTHMYRMADVKADDPFYSETTPFADADVAMRLLLHGKFGFVHRTLTFVRTSNESISSEIEHFDTEALTRRVLLEKYGSRLLEPREFERLRRREAARHHRRLGEAMLRRYPEAYWELHERGAADAGFRITRTGLYAGALARVLEWVGHPLRTTRNLWRRIAPGRAGA